jgi:hypothetical protein
MLGWVRLRGTAQAVLRIAASCHCCPSCSCRVDDEAQQGQTRSAHRQAPWWSGTAAGRRASARPPALPARPSPARRFCLVLFHRGGDGGRCAGGWLAAQPVVETTGGPAICRGQRRVAGCQVTLAQHEPRELQDNRDRTSTSWRAAVLDLPQGLAWLGERFATPPTDESWPTVSRRRPVPTSSGPTFPSAIGAGRGPVVAEDTLVAGGRACSTSTWLTHPTITSQTSPHFAEALHTLDQLDIALTIPTPSPTPACCWLPPWPSASSRPPMR